jgi:hypothetical protein
LTDPAIAQRYAHMIDPIRREVAARLDGLLWADAHAANGK